jgi:CDP-glucose 4,6-dehydratase
MAGLHPEFWAGKRVLLTGHTGFKGSWLTRWLFLLGADVTGFALAPEQNPSLFELAALAECSSSNLGDIRDLAEVSRVVEATEPELVIHMAAQSLVRRSYREPVATYAVNVMGTVHLLDALRRVGSARAVVVVTSDKCYENREWTHGYREEDAMGGHDPYSSSKGCAELVTAAYRRSFFGNAGVASARAGNVIGGGDWSEDRLFPDIVRGAESGHPVSIRNPRSTRPWQHVLDPLCGYLMLAERLWHEPDQFSEAFNFGPRDDGTQAVGDVAQRFVRELGSGRLELAEVDPDAPHEASLLELDARKARARLGWRPRLALEGAVELTARWYRAWLDDPSSARRMLDAQIAEYQSLAP